MGSKSQLPKSINIKTLKLTQCHNITLLYNTFPSLKLVLVPTYLTL